MIRVVLVEPDAWRRRGIAAELGDRIEVVDGDGDADVVLLSYGVVMELGAREVTRLREKYACDVVVYGGEGGPAEAAAVFAAGAKGFVSGSEEPAHVRKAVELVVSGRVWGPREALVMLASRALGDTETLDRHLLEVLRLLNEGLTNKEIGNRLGLAEATVKARMNRLYRRFGVTSRLQLLATAIRRGIVPIRRM